MVVLPETTQRVAAVMKWCRDNDVKIVPRGAGTSLSGGAIPLADGVLLGLGKFNQIPDIDFINRTVTAQPGVTNLGITQAVQDEGFYYATRRPVKLPVPLVAISLKILVVSTV